MVSPKDMAAYTSEFIGTFMLVLSVGCNVKTGSPVWGVTSIALTLMVSIYALGHVSGGHFNPAVSLTMAILGKENPNGKGGPVEMCIYAAVQIIAGICAGLVYSMLFGSMNLEPPGGLGGWWQAAIAEMIYTFMLCFVVLNVACAKQHAGKQFYGIAIGFVVIAGGYAAGHLSGGVFNPAVAFGVDVSSLHLGFGWCLAYTIFECLGAVAAAGLYKICRPDDFEGYTAPSAAEKFGGSNYRKVPCLVSEFLGTYILVLTVGLNVLGGSNAPVWSIAASLMCMVFALGSCSGAHFNPAVTLALICSGRDKITPSDAGLYIVTQFFGGVAAAFTYMALEEGKTFPLQPGASYGRLEALLVEILYTFLLTFVVLNVASIKTPLDEYFGLAIASCVTAGGYAIGAVSGGSLNPAVSLGIGLTSMSFLNCVLYIMVEFLGGALAAVVFHEVHQEEYSKKDLPQ